MATLTKEAAAASFLKLMSSSGGAAALGNVSLLELGEGDYGETTTLPYSHPCRMHLTAVASRLGFTGRHQDA
jgi:hypothetical protein